MSLTYHSAGGARDPVLDGVRGLAIAAVLFHHFVIFSGLDPATSFDYWLLRLGKSSWIGVDLFFVLSGFLITGILFETKSSPHFFRTFYWRRVLRIFPLYYFVLALTFIIIPHFLGDAAPAKLTRDQLWYWTYTSNINDALNGWRPPLYLGHFWSLAIEEQFYLVWPLVVFSFKREQLMKITIGCILAAVVLRFLLPQLGVRPLANYVLMPTRMCSLASGAYLALAIRGPDGIRSLGGSPPQLLLTCGLAVTAMFLFNKGLNSLDPFMRTIGYTILAIGFASLIAMAIKTKSGSLANGILTSRVLIALGKYSYALYVFHQPIVLLLRENGFGADILPRVYGSQLPGWVVFSVTAMAMSMCCAVISWQLLESRFLRLKRHLPYRTATRPSPERRAQTAASG